MLFLLSWYQINGDVEKVNGVNGDAPATNGDVKTEDKETESKDAPVTEETKDTEETKETEETEAQGIMVFINQLVLCLTTRAYLQQKFYPLYCYSLEVAETSKDEGKKMSAKDKIKKKLSMRSLNFLRRKPKSKDDAETSVNEETADKTVDEDKTEEDKQTEDKKTEEEAIEETKVEETVKTDDAKETVAEETAPVAEESTEQKVAEKEPSVTEDTEDKPPTEDEQKEE